MPYDAEDQHVENSLADFTDRLLEQPRECGVQAAPPTGTEELVRLQQTVLQLKQAVSDEQPAPSFVARLRLTLLTEFRRIHGSPSQAAQHDQAQSSIRAVWKRLADSFRYQPRGVSLRLALLALAMLVFTLFFFPSLNDALPAAAGISSYRPWVVLALSAVCVAVVVWLVREKK